MVTLRNEFSESACERVQFYLELRNVVNGGCKVSHDAQLNIGDI